MTIRRKLLLVFLALAVLPIGIVAGGILVGTYRLAERQGVSRLGSYLDAVSERIERRLGTERIFLGMVAAEWSDSCDPERPIDFSEWIVRHRLIVARFEEDPCVVSRILLLPEGGDSALEIRGIPTEDGRVATVAGWIPAESLPPPYQVLRPSPGGGFSDRLGPVTFLGPRGARLALGVPVAGRAGSAGRVLVEELTVFPLLEPLLEGSRSTVPDVRWAAAPETETSGWSFLYHTDLPRIGLRGEGEGSPTVEALSPSQAADQGGWAFERKGDLLSGGGIHPGTGWFIGASLSLSPDQERIRENLGIALLLVGLMAILVVGGILYVTRGIGRSVEEIADGVEAIARGDLERTIRLERNDEFGSIASHLNEMARELILTAESRSIARVSAKVIHDLKGVASQMNLLIYNLKERIGDPEFRAEAVDLLGGLAHQIESLTLLLRKREEGEETVWEPVDLGGLLRPLVETYGGTWPEIAFRVELDRDATVFANRELLREVVENLVANAADAMGGRGEIVVRAGLLAGPGRGKEGGPTHFLEVMDRGVGMSEEFVREKLFRPFVTTKPKGLGLGMYHARLAVVRLGGRIEVNSEVGAGTRVRVTFGRTPSQEARYR
ncbi:MAG: ATP-binding protein [Candidatus Eisenbacteria bacterium]